MATILVIDDDARDRELLAAVLEEQVFSPVRFPSMTDVFTNTIGALAGASIARVMLYNTAAKNSMIA